jgi:tripartite-type tricarboxylate transporter receptor subunit TctC
MMLRFDLSEGSRALDIRSIRQIALSRYARFAAVFLILAGLSLKVSAAENYPARPITIVVPFAAGGPTDTLARLLAGPMSRALGVNVLVEDVTGAAGTVGVGRVAHATPDGYTISLGHWSTHVVNGAIYKLPYDLLRDFEPIALLPSNPMLIVSRTTVPATTLKDLIGWIKSKDNVDAGTAGVGSASHSAGVYFEKTGDVRLQFVPYRGTGPALLDMIGGRIDVMVDQASNSAQQVRDGKIRAYAVTAKTRLPTFPDIPTVDEAGVPGFHINIWNGLWAPAGTPKDIVAKLNRAAVAALADASVRERLAALGLEIPAPDQETPAALGALQRAEIDKWWPIIKAAHIEAE